MQMLNFSLKPEQCLDFRLHKAWENICHQRSLIYIILPSIQDQAQLSSSIHLEMAKENRCGGQSRLQKNSGFFNKKAFTILLV